MEQERKLPIYTIAGTEFIVDVAKSELRENLNPDNTIEFDKMAYGKRGYRFIYNKELKNIPVSLTNGFEAVFMPNMTELDPTGMAQKYGQIETEIIGKTDVQLMVDQKQLALRDQGELPVIEISGHTFNVDLAMDSLRSKENFIRAIYFSDIKDYFIENSNQYRIPYNPVRHSFEKLDYENIKAIPKDIIVIEFPRQQQLDPVGYAKIHGLDKEQLLWRNPLQMQIKAKEVSWDDTTIKQIIARNLKRELEKQQSQSLNKSIRKRGRGI